MTAPNMPTKRYDWARLNHLQVGRYAEYLAKMEFAMFGFDIYTTEVDDKGIDFVVRNSSKEFHEVQVKSLRGTSGYVFMTKTSFTPAQRLHLVLVLLHQGQPPAMYLIPSMEWLRADRPSFLVDRPYGPGMKSAPEYGINVAAMHLAQLGGYAIERQLAAVA